MNRINIFSTPDLAKILNVKSASSVIRRAKREGWQSIPRKERGGGHEWLLSSMPKETRNLVINNMLAQELAKSPEIAGQNDSPICAANGTGFCAKSEKEAVLQQNDANLPQKSKVLAIKQANNRNREIANARLALVREIERLSRKGGKTSGIMYLVEAARCGELPERLVSLADLASATTKEGILSRRTLFRWVKAFEAEGFSGLLPRQGRVLPTPDWFGDFLKFYQKPQNPSAQMAYDQFAREWLENRKTQPPSIYAVRRQLGKMSVQDRESGRATGNAMLKLRPFKRRDTSELWPGDVYTADGTTLDAEIINPFHGQPCKPEVTAILDVATRKCVGFSMGLSESAITVLDALRAACLYGGIPSLFYTDNGPGYVNRLMCDDRTGMFQRLGITPTNSIPGRPQGKGLMERAVKTLWVRAAQGLESYTGAMMDPDAARKNFKKSRDELAKGKRGILPLWNEVMAHLTARIDEYNNTPHRALPRHRDAQGRMVHYTPNGFWQAFVERGFEIKRVEPGLENELFMPGEIRMTRNGWVSLMNGKFFSEELAEYHGKEIEARYDIHHLEHIYCWTTDGQFLCKAERDGNTIPYFPESMVEAARERRTKAQIRRIEKKVERIVPGAKVMLPPAEGPFSAFISADSQPSVNEALEELVEIPVAEPEILEPEKRPLVFMTQLEKYRWVMRHPEQQTSEDLEFLSEFREGEDYANMKDLLEIEGIA